MTPAAQYEKPTSFKAAKGDGRLKSREIFRVDVKTLKTEPGFNLREPGPELEEHIEGLKNHFLRKGGVPPIEVRLNNAGHVVVVDGHCRREAMLRALKIDKELDPLLDCKPFEGDEVERVAKIITSAAGKALTPLEVGFGYQRLAKMGLSPIEIGERFSKTRQHVDQWLLVANAGPEVHALIRSGDVSMTMAVDIVRKHGDKAAEFIAGKTAVAKGKGKTRVTAASVAAPKLKQKAWQPLVDASDALFQSLPTETKVILEEVKAAPSQHEGKTVTIPAALLAQLMASHGDIIEAREEMAVKDRERAAKAKQVDALEPATEEA